VPRPRARRATPDEPTFDGCVSVGHDRLHHAGALAIMVIIVCALVLLGSAAASVRL